MKVLTRKAFLEMPAGTIFARGQRWYFRNLLFKGDSLFSRRRPDYIGDFIYLDLVNIDSASGDQWVDRLEEMLENGVSYPMDNEGFGSDRSFDNAELFLVYEKADLMTLRDRLDEAIAVCDEKDIPCPP